MHSFLALIYGPVHKKMRETIGMGMELLDQPDPQNPIGAKGIGEPLMGCAAAALLCAISDAMGGHYFNRTPVVPDMIVNAMAGKYKYGWETEIEMEYAPKGLSEDIVRLISEKNDEPG